MTTAPNWRTSGMTLSLVLASAAGLTIARADPPSDRSFSSLCTEADSGDITGTRIKITGSAPDLTLSYEEPEGAIVATSTTKDVTYVPATGALSFKLTTEAGPLSFQGHASDTQLEGLLRREDGTEEALRLALDKGGEGETACGGAAEAAKPEAAKPGPRPEPRPEPAEPEPKP